MLAQALIALRATVATLILTTGLYPLLVTGAAQLAFREKADGSRVTNWKGEVVGSALIGQPFVSRAYFQPRPSAAGSGYDATASGGSNLGPTSRKLRDRVEAEVGRLRRENPEAGAVPVELVSASASGLDPHLSPQAALWQVLRIARARGVLPERIEALVEANVESRTLGVLGEPHVNILELNLAMDRQFGSPPRGTP